MAHWSREELIDSLDQAPPPARLAHLDACAHCRAERDALVAVLRDVSRVQVPEPSPLFWDRLSARVRESLADEPTPVAPRWLSPGWSSPGWLSPAWVSPAWVSWASGHWAWSAVTLALCITVGSVGWYQWRHDTTGLRGSGASPHASSAARAMEPRTNGGRTAARRLPPVADTGERVAPSVSTRGAAVPRIVPASASDADWNLMMQVVDDVTWDDEGQVGGLGSVRPGTTDAVVKELTSDERQELLRLLREEMARQPSS
jgi:hypothetical protein